MREPALAFIESLREPMAAISPEFPALAKRVGGCLMRIHRDTRFSPDKTPYKTNIGIQFRHRLGKDVHAPGFYVHIEPGHCFLGAGIWRPDGRTLARLRAFMADNPAGWRQAAHQGPFARHYRLDGERLRRPPRGYGADHPLIDDLKRKDLIGVCTIDPAQVVAGDFSDRVGQSFARARPLVAYLCQALDLPL